MNKLKYLLYAFLVVGLVGCAGDEELPFVEYDGLGYGAFPRLIDGVNGGFDHDDIAGSGIDFTVEFYDDAQGANVQSYEWDVTYAGIGPVPLASASAPFSLTSPDGYPSEKFEWTMTEIMDALGLATADDLQFGQNFIFNATLTKTDGSSFTHTTTDANLTQGTFNGLFLYTGEIENVPNPDVFKSDLGGVFNVVSTCTDQGAGYAWDMCGAEMATWSGVMEWKMEHLDPQGAGLYQFITTTDAGDEFTEDASMGAYYACYETATQAGLPSGDMRLVDNCGTLVFQGASQWGETYSFTSIAINGDELTLGWTNDYGEGAITVITRTDGKMWPTNLSI